RAATARSRSLVKNYVKYFRRVEAISLSSVDCARRAASAFHLRIMRLDQFMQFRPRGHTVDLREEAVAPCQLLFGGVFEVGKALLHDQLDCGRGCRYCRGTCKRPERVRGELISDSQECPGRHFVSKPIALAACHFRISYNQTSPRGLRLTRGVVATEIQLGPFQHAHPDKSALLGILGFWGFLDQVEFLLPYKNDVCQKKHLHNYLYECCKS
ncbi:hypothetical protein ACFDR9_005603, partial [Janthinobacterium sp. CG_23.3]